MSEENTMTEKQKDVVKLEWEKVNRLREHFNAFLGEIATVHDNDCDKIINLTVATFVHLIQDFSKSFTPNLTLEIKQKIAEKILEYTLKSHQDNSLKAESENAEEIEC